jgi:hypothetical protein
MMNLGSGMASFIANVYPKTATSAFSKQTLKPEVFPNAIREKVLWGPFPLNPSTSKHKPGGLKLDSQSDVIEEIVAGLCNNCMVLKGTAEVTDKDGKRLDLASKIYTHHVIVADLGERAMVLPPLTPSANACPGGQKPEDSTGGLLGGMGGMSHGGANPKTPDQSSSAAPPSGMGHSHGRRSPQTPKAAGSPKKFSIFIGQGNEGDATIFAPINSTALKSGYWIGKDDRIAATAELVNYDTKTQDVYISIDVEYISMESRPKDYLDVGIGALKLMQCGELALFPPKDKSITYTSPDSDVSNDGWIISVSKFFL